MVSRLTRRLGIWKVSNSCELRDGEQLEEQRGDLICALESNVTSVKTRHRAAHVNKHLGRAPGASTSVTHVAQGADKLGMTSHGSAAQRQLAGAEMNQTAQLVVRRSRGKQGRRLGFSKLCQLIQGMIPAPDR